MHKANFQPSAESHGRCGGSGADIHPAGHQLLESRHTDKWFRPRDPKSFPGRAETLTARLGKKKKLFRQKTKFFLRFFFSPPPVIIASFFLSRLFESPRSSLEGSRCHEQRGKPGYPLLVCVIAHRMKARPHHHSHHHPTVPSPRMSRHKTPAGNGNLRFGKWNRVRKHRIFNWTDGETRARDTERRTSRKRLGGGGEGLHGGASSLCPALEVERDDKLMNTSVTLGLR